ncbi:tetratricopeptide repeat protein [Cerasicoccus frondis]|uniref:tetratricopeptide repeat protein n=1 Tax=Cerasicoccus frondis TaxID=490090 RepID=UPI002852A758|nr:tetratricopeptide repeat protein [Cerasicoccus frondis]
MKNFQLATIVSALAISVSVAQAKLIWTPEEGWRMEGGATQALFGNTLEEAPTGTALELMNQARAKQEDGSLGGALDLYDDVIDDYPESIYAPEAHFQRGKIYTERHQFESAQEEFQQIIARYPNYDNFNAVIEAMYNLAEKVQDGSIPYLWGTIPWFPEPAVGIEVYEEIVAAAPFSEYAPLSLMNIALMGRDTDKPEDAIDALDRLINNYPNSVLTPDAYLQLADVYASLVQGPSWDQGATREAVSFYQDYLILYPDSTGSYEAEAGLYYMRETLAESKYEVGDFYWKYRNNPRAARVMYGEAITVSPQSAIAKKAEEMIAKIDSGVEPPMTPVDWIFGRYQRPSYTAYEDQSKIDALEDQAFQIEQSEAFLETPGAEALETVDGDDVKEYEGVGAPIDDYFVDPETGALIPMPIEPLDPDQMIPYNPPGPDTKEQKAIDQFQQDQAENQDVPAGG